MFMRFPGGTVVKNPPANAGNVGSIPVPGRPPGGRSGNPLPYSYLLIPMGWGTWQATVHGVAKSWSQLSNWTTTKDVYILIPGTWEYVNINGKKKKRPYKWNQGSVQFSSVAQSCPILCDLMNRSTPGLPVHHQLPEFTQTHVHWVSDAIQPSHPLSSPSPPAPNPPSIRVFSNESTLLMRWPKYWSFRFSIIPSKDPI